MKSKRISPFVLNNHEFLRATRALMPIYGIGDLFKALIERRRYALRLVARNMSLLIVGAVWLEVSESQSSLTIALLSFSVSIPKLYLVGALTFLAATSVTSFIAYWQVNSYLWVLGRRFGKSLNADALAVSFDSGNAWVPGYSPQFRHVISGNTHKFLGVGLVLLLAFPILAVFVASVLVVASHLGEAALKRSISGFELTVVCASSIMLLLSFALLFAHFLPFYFQKNELHIRWSILFPMYRRWGAVPPALENWIK